MNVTNPSYEYLEQCFVTLIKPIITKSQPFKKFAHLKKCVGHIRFIESVCRLVNYLIILKNI